MARAQAPNPVRRVLTAAAVMIQQRRSGAGGSAKTLAQPWQREALAYYDSVGEIRYAADFYSVLGRVDYVVCTGSRDEPHPVTLTPPDGEPVDANAQAVIDVWDRVQDPGGGRAQLIGAYGRLQFLTGESYLTASWEASDSGIPGVEGPLVECWETLSVDELEVNKAEGWVKRYENDRSGSGDAKRYMILENGETPQADSMMLWRLWRKHPRRSGMADSAMRSVLELCDELLLLRRAIRGRARSRISDAGLFLLPDEAFLDGNQPAGTDDDPMKDPLFAKIIEAAVTPLRDEGSAASVVPAMLRMSSQYIDAARLIKFRDSSETYPEIQLRQDCVTAIARGLPLPAEVITGLADVNHWGQWFISDQTWKHIEPDAIRLCAEMSDAYLRPALEQEGIDPDAYFIWFDKTPVIVRPDRSRDAKDLHDRYAISYAALRTANFFTEEDAPTPDEVAERIAIDQARRARESQQGVISPGEVASDVVQAEPNDGQGPSESQQASGENRSALAWLNGGLDMALMRCYELAGSRLRQQIKKDATLAAEYAETPNWLLPAAMGRDTVIAATGYPDPGPALVRGGGAMLVAGLTKAGAGDVAAVMISQTVEAEAARRLWTATEHAIPV